MQPFEIASHGVVHTTLVKVTRLFRVMKEWDVSRDIWAHGICWAIELGAASNDLMVVLQVTSTVRPRSWFNLPINVSLTCWDKSPPNVGKLDSSVHWTLYCSTQREFLDIQDWIYFLHTHVWSPWFRTYLLFFAKREYNKPNCLCVFNSVRFSLVRDIHNNASGVPELNTAKRKTSSFSKKGSIWQASQ